MAQPLRFPYTLAGTTEASLMPRPSLTLTHAQRAVEIVGLLDTGAAVNVLPYPVGVALGADWDQQSTVISLAGSLGRVEARALVLLALHPQLTLDGPIRLVFAWTRAEDVPVIFGQTNVFMEFNVCFYRSQATFEVHPRGG
jgi:hypothetical protein